MKVVFYMDLSGKKGFNMLSPAGVTVSPYLANKTKNLTQSSLKLVERIHPPALGCGSELSMFCALNF